MKNTITKNQLTDHLVSARAALTLQIRDELKRRNGFSRDFFRKNIRENVAALRVLSNLATIDATLYSKTISPKIAKVEKILGV